MRSVRRRCSDPSTTFLMCSGRLSGAPRTFDVEPELAGDGDVVAERRERFSDKLFARMGAVHLGGIEERDASFVRRANGSDALVSVRGRSVVGADAHAPGAQFRDVQRSEFSGLHVVVAPVADFLGCVRACGQHQRSGGQPGTDEGGSSHEVAATDTTDIVVLSHFGGLLGGSSVSGRSAPRKPETPRTVTVPG